MALATACDQAAHSSLLRRPYTVHADPGALPARLNCVEPSDCWSPGLYKDPLLTPSNNTLEVWHSELLRLVIPGMFRGSAENVFKVVLRSALLHPTILTLMTLAVPAVPSAMVPGNGTPSQPRISLGGSDLPALWTGHVSSKQSHTGSTT